jgi:hypothetical protein
LFAGSFHNRVVLAVSGEGISHQRATQLLYRLILRSVYSTQILDFDSDLDLDFGYGYSDRDQDHDFG